MNISCRFRLDESDDGYVVSLSVGNEPPAVCPFAIDLDKTQRIWQVIDEIEAGHCSIDDLLDVGSQLWSGLIAGDVGARFEAVRADPQNQYAQFHVRLQLPLALQRIPWETLYDDRSIGFLSTDARFCIIRDLPEQVDFMDPPERKDGPLRVLVVIPVGSGLNENHEWNNIKVALGRLEQSVVVERLDGLVTPNRLESRLRDDQFDVLHFVGHGDVDEEWRVRVRLNSDEDQSDEYWMDGETFATLFAESTVRLVVLNCCLGAVASRSRSLSGLGPFLMRKGIPSVIAMQYEIPDEVSIRFAESFYTGLVSGGEQAGDVWLAVERARMAVDRNKKESTARGFVTPVLYFVEGYDKLFEIEEVMPETVATPTITLVPSESRLVPKELEMAFKSGRCVPVIGADLLKVGAVRSSSIPPGPGELAEILATDINFERTEEFESEWLQSQLLESVCQLYEFKEERYKLIPRVQDIYHDARPNQALEDVATWTMPGLFYCQIDGLMELALANARQRVVVTNMVDQAVDTDAESTLVVNLRGSWSDYESLVLTEEDHYGLWERLNRMAPQVRNMLYESPGRSLIFLGVHPRDPLVRQLCVQLLSADKQKFRGPLYFVCPEHSDLDEAYWGVERFKVQWIEGELEQVIAELTPFANSSQ